jgi:hypothetical protein
MKKTIALDVDGTLAFYNGWKGLDHFGDPIPGAVEFTKQLAKYYDIVIFTCRCTPDLHRLSANLLENKVKAWLDEHGFVYHHIYSSPGKPYADVYIDDRAVSCRPQDHIKGLEYREYDSVLKTVVALSPPQIPMGFDLKIESTEVKPKPRVAICTCIVPQFEDTGPCKRCGKPMTFDYEVSHDLPVVHNFDPRELLYQRKDLS